MFNSKKIKKLQFEIESLNLLVRDMQDDIFRLEHKESINLDFEIENKLRLFLDIQNGSNGMAQGGMC